MSKKPKASQNKARNNEVDPKIQQLLVEYAQLQRDREQIAKLVQQGQQRFAQLTQKMRQIDQKIIKREKKRR